MANVSPISMKNNTKLSINKVSAKTNSVKVADLKNYNAYEDEKIDYNKQISDLSVDNNIGSIGDINLDGKVNASDEKNLQEYLNLDSKERLVYATEHSHMFETSRLLEKYKDNSNLNEIINMAYNGETYPRIEQTADGTYGDTAESIAQKQENEKIIMEFREAFTQDELTVGESGIDNFMSIVNGKSIYYDINGDGKTDLNDLTALQKYNQIMNDYKNDKNPSSDPKINTSGNFADLTDYQNVSFTAIDFIQYLAFNGYDISKLSGKTIKESISLFNVDEDDYQLKYFKTLIANGFGDYKIVEVVQDGSFDAIVVQDPNGNYRVFYNSSKAYGDYTNDIGDYLFDARNVFEEQFVNGWVDSFLKDSIDKAGSTAGTIGGAAIGSLLMGPVGIFVGGSIGGETVENIGLGAYKKLIDIIRNGLDSDSIADATIIDFIDTQLSNSGIDESMKNQIMDVIKNGGLNGQYEDQQNKAKALADKYYNKAAGEGKKLSIQGYSLGGNLAEESYLFLCDREGANDVLDGIVLFNPYHDNLTKEEVDKIKNAKGFELYCAEGDMVSTVFNYNDFKDDAKYLYMDYKPLLEEQAGDSNNGFEFEQLANFNAIFGFTHMNQPYLTDEFKGTESRKAIAEDGSIRKNVEGYDVHGHHFEELSKYLFGGEVITNVDDLGKTMVTKAASKFLGVNLTEDDLKDPSKVVENTGTKFVQNKVFSWLLSYINSQYLDGGGASSDF